MCWTVVRSTLRSGVFNRRIVLWLRGVKDCCMNCVGEKSGYEFKMGLTVVAVLMHFLSRKPVGVGQGACRPRPKAKGIQKA